MRGFGYRSTFLPRPWSEVRAFELAVFGDIEPDHYLLRIIDSVIAHGAIDALAVTTSMHDLVVALHPVPDPPTDALIVRAPGSLDAPPDGNVRITYSSVTGRDTTIDRPAAEAVDLFWRFCREQFGIHRSDRGN